MKKTRCSSYRGPKFKFQHPCGSLLPSPTPFPGIPMPPYGLYGYHGWFVKAHLKPTSEDLQFLRTIAASCEICQKTDPNTKYRKIKYFLVMVDSFSNWVEAYPVSNKRAQTVTDVLKEIIPRFGVPASLQSDNGPEFTSQVSQTLAKALNIPWHFHIPYRPQSSGKVEHTNRSLKSILTKMSQELHLDWAKVAGHQRGTLEECPDAFLLVIFLSFIYEIKPHVIQRIFDIWWRQIFQNIMAENSSAAAPTESIIRYFGYASGIHVWVFSGLGPEKHLSRQKMELRQDQDNMVLSPLLYPEA
ncbi:hypothetical protein STEG23_028483, partial [Scotinomys teguina]